jgi:TRAP-type C4-dicarboxylate transport system substrate-binding protein
MSITIRKKVVSLFGTLLLGSSLYASTEPITLTLHHFLSSKSPAHTKFFVPWAEQIEKESNGKLKIEIFPSMSMGGKPNELYKQVRDGSADIVWTVAGYTPGVFQRTEVYELPTVHKGNGVATSVAIEKNFDMIKEDYVDVKPLVVYVAAGNAIHMVDKKVQDASDLKGLKLRSPSRTGAWLIEELGAEPVGMPLSDVPQALSKKAIDGAFFPFEVFPPFKFHQITQYSAEGENGERFGTSVFLFLMNKDKFNKLPKDLQKVIENNTGLEKTRELGQIWMDIEEPGIKLQDGSNGGQVVKLTSEQMKKFDEAGQRVVTRWINEVTEKGLDGNALVEKARKTIKENE